MANATARPRSPQTNKDWWLAALVGLLAASLGIGAWYFLQRSDSAPNARNGQPLPMWVDLGQMTPQMSDGRMVRMHVNLMVKSKADLETLTPMVPAFQNMVTQLGADRETDDMTDPDAMHNMASDIRIMVNNELAKQREGIRVDKVAFTDWVLLP